jgi:hypothetical protein
MLDADLSQVEKFTKELGKFAKRAVPFAQMMTMNEAAFQGRREAIGVIEQKMTTRSAFTKRSIQVRKATKAHPEAVLGSTQRYMLDQEFGATKVAKGSQGVAIATSYAAGEGDTARPRKRLPRKANALRNIQLKNTRARGKTKKQHQFAKVRETIRSGQRFVFLDLGRTKGVFRVIGKGKRARIRMVSDMSRKSVVIPARPWLAPAVAATEPQMAGMYIKQLQKQVKRQRLFLEKRSSR